MKKINFLLLSALLLCIGFKPAQALKKGWASFIGPIVSVPVGAVAGTLRGALSKGAEYSDTFSEAMGDETAGKMIGIPVGGLTGGLTGGITGFLKGIVDGAILGVQEPLTAKSAGLEGEVLDYEPYKVFDSTESI